MRKVLALKEADSEILGKIRSSGSFEVVQTSHPSDADVAEAEILFCDHPPENFHAISALRLIQLGSVGYTQLERLRLAKRGVRVCNARGVFDVPIAEWNISMMINLVRDLRGMIRNQESRAWDRDARFQREIRGSVVGIWGYGGIGRETARMGKLLGLKIHALTRHAPRILGDEIFRLPGTGDPDATLPDRFFTPDQSEEFLSGLDFLVLAMPMNAGNEGIIGEKELMTMPDHAFVLNPARGPLIRERALMEALEKGRIAGAALDTHYHYPLPDDHPLWQMPNVILTPHISGSSGGTHYLSRIWEIFQRNLDSFDRGLPLLNELTPEEIARLG